jgi:hypothetical protein
MMESKMSKSWWDEDVQFLKPKAQRTAPKGVAIVPGLDQGLKTCALAVAAVPAGLVAGAVLGHVFRSSLGRSIGHSIIRGFIYREIFNMTGIRVYGGYNRR